MYDQAFSRSNLARSFNRLDFRHIKTPAALDLFKTAILDKADESVKSGFHATANPLIKFPFKGRDIFKFSSLSDELIARTLCRNLKANHLRLQNGRTHISQNLKSFLEEGVPYRLYRLDVKSFYESFQLSYVLSKVNQLVELSPLSKKLLRQLLACHAILGGAGIPRGLAISASLAEYLMADFDRRLNVHNDVFFFARYVDDIIIITAARENSATFLRDIERQLPPGLRFSTTKKDVREVKGKVSPSKATESRIKLLEFDYLGYCYHLSEPVRQKNLNPSDHFRDVQVDIAKRKVVKYKTRISRSFFDFGKTGDWLLLRDRIKFLTKNFSVYNAKAGGKKKAGIYHSYPLAMSDARGLQELDRFLRSAILTKKGRLYSASSIHLTGAQKRELLSDKFSSGHADINFVHFSATRLNQIQACWQY